MLQDRDYNQSHMCLCSSVARLRRFVVGLLILLLVDFIWVASSELTEYIFKNQNFRNVLLSYQFCNGFLSRSIFLYKTWHFDLKLVFCMRFFTEDRV
jgi:hypothetical protein